MKKVYKKIKMEKVMDIIRAKGFYYIKTEDIYPELQSEKEDNKYNLPNYNMPRYIIVTDDSNIKSKRPELSKMIIVPVDKFAKMAELYNNYHGSETKFERRNTRYHNAEGYFEDIIETENGEKQLKPMEIDMHPVENAVDNNVSKDKIAEAMNHLTEAQRRRISMFYFQRYTEREIAEIEGVNRYAVRDSIKCAIKKLKKYL